jgi:3-hydroxybutyryl-CoA dehydrogenase
MTATAVTDRIQRMAIVGAGVMGTGIAELAAGRGLDVLLVARDRDRARDALERIEARVRRRTGRGALTVADGDTLLANISSSGDGAEAVRDADLVIEAVPEVVEVKRRVFAVLDRTLAPEVILASTTSTIPITLLATATARPERVLGMHFFNPAPVVEGVELVRGEATSEDTLAQGLAFVRRLGLKPVVALDRTGFITSRLIHPYLNEAAHAVMDGNAPADVDAAMVHCLRMPMGPCALMDLIGIDVVLACLESLQREYGERFAPAPLLRDMAGAGHLGRKTGRGFHDYTRAFSVRGG